MTNKSTSIFPSLLTYNAKTVGVTLLAMCLWVRSDSALWVYTQNLDIERYYYATYYGLAAGCLLTIISIAGCFGVLIDSKLLLTTYTILSVLTIVLELGVVICSLKPPLGDSLQAKLGYELQQHIEQLEHSANSRKFLDLIQLKLQCCGGETFLDYKIRDFSVPQSCSSDITNNINYRSCGEMLRRYLEIRAALMAGLSLILFVVQVFAIFISIVYMKFRRQLYHNI